MKYIYILLLIFSPTILLSQNVNLIIKVNNEIIVGSMTSLDIEFREGTTIKKFPASYYPGDLILNEETQTLLKSDTINKFYLTFYYHTFKNEKQEVVKFEIELNKSLLKMPYLIANIYDFRDKEYKRRYQYHTKENYIVNINCPSCGILIPMK